MTEVLEPVEVDAPSYTPPVRSKRVVVQHPDGTMAIIGETTEQPATTINDVSRGLIFGLVALKHDRYYLYKPVMLPGTGMSNAHGDGSYKPAQR